MANLTMASRELFRRSPDERIESLPELAAFCRRLKEESLDRWHLPGSLQPFQKCALHHKSGNSSFRALAMLILAKRSGHINVYRGGNRAVLMVPLLSLNRDQKFLGFELVCKGEGLSKIEV